jgi:hypothetical protein
MRFFGTGAKTVRMNIGSVSIPCDHCKGQTVHTLQSQRTWLTLLFIGLIPLRYKYVTVCSGCKSVAED